MKLDDFLRFAKIASVMRNGSSDEMKAMRSDEDTVKFVARMADDGVVDAWLKLYDEIAREI
jgi:hypothetical protein